MAKGRNSGSARLSLFFGIGILCCLLALAKPTLGATYTVGDSAGWGFNVIDWPKGKSFKAGDVLVFNYAKSEHNVVVVNKAGYDSCIASSGSKVYESGNDHITLGKGQSYFISTFPGPGDCQAAGMKIAISAS